DTATVSSGNTSFTIGGTVSYQLYTGLSCAAGNQSGSPSVKTMASGNVPDSAQTAALAAGNYSYQATYSGDGNYSTSTGACEPFTVNPATPTTATIVKDSASPANTVDSGSNKAALGTQVHDTATVSSGNTSF